MADNAIRKSRKVDVIFCIDGTGSMSPCFEHIKKRIKSFPYGILQEMDTMLCSKVEELNFKVITFRNYAADGDQAMVQSEWFSLMMGDREKFESYLDGINAEGGGLSQEENGLEALYYAITADWRSTGKNDRQIILLITDSDAFALRGSGRVELPDYPAEMVDMDGLIDLWMGTCPSYMSQDALKLKQRNKHLYLMAPTGTKYEEIADKMNHARFMAFNQTEPIDVESFFRWLLWA